MRSAKRKSSAARSFGTVRAHAAPAVSAEATAASTCAAVASGTSAMHSPVAGSSTRSDSPPPATRVPLIKSLVCMFSPHGHPLLLVRIVERQRVGNGRYLDVLASNLELGAVNGDRNVEPGDRHRLAGEARGHGAGDDADLLAVRIPPTT